MAGFDCKCIPLTLRASCTMGQFAPDRPKIRGTLLEKPCTILVTSRLPMERIFWIYIPRTLPAYLTHGASFLRSVNNTGQQRFCPKRKNVCFLCIFGSWVQICFQNFSITHTFALHWTMWKHKPTLLLLPDQYHWCNSTVQTQCSVS